ncbi:MAG: hypothetical protein Q8O89_05155 [Nanoarchaeota archaeon]|nr:hypothetical protein [Nanoarchaeota archaeon]
MVYGIDKYIVWEGHRYLEGAREANLRAADDIGIGGVMKDIVHAVFPEMKLAEKVNELFGEKYHRLAEEDQQNLEYGEPGKIIKYSAQLVFLGADENHPLCRKTYDNHALMSAAEIENEMINDFRFKGGAFSDKTILEIKHSVDGLQVNPKFREMFTSAFSDAHQLWFYSGGRFDDA